MNLLSSRTVSFDDENLVLVDKDDQAIGYKKKNQCHHNNGVLHRAFSILIFNDNNELLLQKRSRNKLLWPLFWSNSCCSHPRQGESLHQATQRRMNEELGFNTALKFIFKIPVHRFGK
jgi:isopentenyl-diphosphate Delta-isomerase